VVSELVKCFVNQMPGAKQHSTRLQAGE